MDFNGQYNGYFERFEKKLSEILASLNTSAPALITDAMRYSVAGGGKRIRPVLCLAAADMLSADIEKACAYAVAVELIHSYSLVHDDLPAMDNDDYRRGKFSTHKKFGEAVGILAGDALLNFAFEVCLGQENLTDCDFAAMKILAESAGYSGMIAGQVLDLQYEKKDAGEKELYEIYSNKTAKLITVPLLIASELCSRAYYEQLERVGYHLGIMFQIADDLLDVSGDLATLGKTPHKDEKEDKLTSVKVFGKTGAVKNAKFHYESALEILKKIPGSTFLCALANKIYGRNS